MKKLLLINVFLFFVFASTTNVFAQVVYNYAVKVNTLRTEIINDENNQKLQRNDRSLSDADAKMREVHAMEQRMKALEEIIANRRGREKRQAKRELKNLEKEVRSEREMAHSAYIAAFDEMYLIYKQYIASLPTNNRDKTRQAQILFDEAKSNFNSAKSMETNLVDKDPYVKISAELDKAFELRSEGINLMVEGFWVFLKPETTEEDLGSVEDTLDIEDPIDVNSDPDAGIWFKVQIIAVSRPLTNNEIATVYKGSEQVTEYYFNGYYKYFVGKFKSYNDARDLQDATGVSDAFVVGFENGVAIDIITAKNKVGQ